MANFLVAQHETAELAAGLTAEVELRQQQEFADLRDESDGHGCLDDDKRGERDGGVHPDAGEDDTHDDEGDYEVVEVVAHDAFEGGLGLLGDHLLDDAEVHHFTVCQTLVECVPTVF